MFLRITSPYSLPFAFSPHYPFLFSRFHLSLRSCHSFPSPFTPFPLIYLTLFHFSHPRLPSSLLPPHLFSRTLVSPFLPSPCSSQLVLSLTIAPPPTFHGRTSCSVLLSSPPAGKGLFLIPCFYFLSPSTLPLNTALPYFFLPFLFRLKSIFYPLISLFSHTCTCKHTNFQKHTRTYTLADKIMCAHVHENLKIRRPSYIISHDFKFVPQRHNQRSLPKMSPAITLPRPHKRTSPPHIPSPYIAV